METSTSADAIAPEANTAAINDHVVTNVRMSLTFNHSCLIRFLDPQDEQSCWKESRTIVAHPEPKARYEFHLTCGETMPLHPVILPLHLAMESASNPASACTKSAANGTRNNESRSQRVLLCRDELILNSSHSHTEEAPAGRVTVRTCYQCRPSTHERQIKDLGGRNNSVGCIDWMRNNCFD